MGRRADTEFAVMQREQSMKQNGGFGLWLEEFDVGLMRESRCKGGV